MAKGITAKQRAARKRNMAIARSARKKGGKGKKGIMKKVGKSSALAKSVRSAKSSMTSGGGKWNQKSAMRGVSSLRKKQGW